MRIIIDVSSTDDSDQLAPEDLAQDLTRWIEHAYPDLTAEAEVVSETTTDDYEIAVILQSTTGAILESKCEGVTLHTAHNDLLHEVVERTTLVLSIYLA